MKRRKCDCCHRDDPVPGCAWCAACKRICNGMDRDRRFRALLKLQPRAILDEREARILRYMIRFAAKLAKLPRR